MSDMRQVFLDAIEADPYDLDTRKVFADWLDEFGDDSDADLAGVQRAWTREKQDAIVWLTEYAADVRWDWDEEPQRLMTYDELIEAAKAHVSKRKEYHPGYLHMERLYDDNDEFWPRIELATGEKVADEDKVAFFGCAC